jgi:predicted O-linked N-acetylglucosamine transferase (SPINDLY family)
MDESVYSERILRLPDSFWCYDPLDNADVPVGPLPALSNGGVTFGCLNNFSKINPAMLDLWGQVLKQTPGSRLIVLATPGGHRQRTVDHLAGQGVDPGRIEFVDRQPRRAYLELYHRIDVGLDTFPYNGHTTSLDSFWMGVPVVTKAGTTVVSRAGWCQASNLGFTELVGRNDEEFVSIAVKLACDLPRLQSLRFTLRAKMEQSPLMDAAKFSRGVEAAYRQMWRTWTLRKR